MAVSGMSNGNLYSITVDNHTIESSKLEKFADKKSLKNRFILWASKIQTGNIIFSTMALMVSTPFLFIFIVEAFGKSSMLFAIPYVLITLGLGIYLDIGLKQKVDKATDKEFIRWYEFDKIRKLSNYEEIANNYFKKFSPAQIEEFHNNCKRLSSIKIKLAEFENLSSVMDEKTMFKNDVADKKRVLLEKKNEVLQYFKNLEDEMIQESLDEQVLSAVSMFDDFMSEEMKELMSADKYEEVEIKVENKTMRR